MALLLVGAALLVPVGRLLWASVTVEEVVTTRGVVFRAVGEVREERGALAFGVQAAPGAERVPVRVPLAEVAEQRRVRSLAHYEHVLGDARTRTLVLDSLLLALAAALVALALGLPQAWALARRRVPGLPPLALAALAAAPLLLPPFLLGMGAARPAAEALEGVFGLSGRSLQRTTAAVLLGAFLAPVVALFVARAWSRVPAGAYEAAVLLGGPAAARRHVLLPRLAPPALAAFALTLVLALADFAVPDLMTFLLPGGGTPLAVFSKEVQLQWKQEQNTGRAVATGAPLLLLCLLGLLLAAWWLRRARAFPDAASGRALAPKPLTWRAALPWALAYLAPLALGLALPLAGLCSWAGSGGETVASGSAPAPAPVAAHGRLFDFAGALERTPGATADRDRWLKTGVVATVLTLLMAWPLAAWARSGGRFARGLVGLVGALALAAPGLVLGIGALLTWSGIGFVEDGVLRSAFALAARALPLALLGVGVALAEARRGHEEAAASLGAGPLATARHVTLPLAAPALLATAVLVFVLALRELDAVVLLESALFPLRLYDKIHYSRLADEANLAFLCIAWVIGPLVLLALLLAFLRRRRVGGPPPRPPVPAPPARR